jgi:RND superfamily putative drug exporter
VERAVAINRAALPGLTGVAGAIPISNIVGGVPFARESGTSSLTYLFFPEDIGPVGRTGLAARFVERHVSAPAAGLVGVTGAIPARAEQRDQIQDALPIVELATIVLVGLVVGLHFRSLPAPLVNLLVVAVAYIVATRVTAALGRLLGVSVPSEVQPVLVVLLFGIITDYFIFMASRFRAHLHSAPTELLAAARTSTDLAGIILTAGLAVAGASAALAVAELGFLRAFGPGMAISVLTGLAAALTLLPATFAMLGGRLFWPGGRLRGREPRAGARAVRLAATRPWLTVVGATVLLLIAATGVLRLEVGQTLIRGLPAQAEARQAYHAAAQAFSPGILSPTVLLVEERGISRKRTELARLQRLLEGQRGVAAVAGPREQPLDRALGAALSRTGDAARLAIVLEDDPLGAAAIRTLTRLQRRLPTLLADAGLAQSRAGFAGDTALAAETVNKTASDLLRVAPVALCVVLIVVVLFLRTLVAPLYLVAASGLALAAALGITVYVFQDLLGYGELTFFVPFAAAVLLLALGSDYNVFVTGRIAQAARTAPLRRAVVEAGTRAAGPVAVAGLVLAASFALLALVPIRAFRELAFMMAVGLILDAFLVRTLLVPALIAGIGRVSPSKPTEPLATA